MADNTLIEWADSTCNAVNGCSVVSPGCTNCYAMKLAGTRLRNHPSRAGLTDQTKAGPVWNGKVSLNEAQLLQPLSWTRPRRIFWNAHGDLFHDAVPDEWIDRVFAVCALTPQHQHLILTKRSARMREYMTSHNSGGTSAIIAATALDSANWIPREMAVKCEPQFQNVWPIPNVWLGVSVEDQARADQRVPDLLATPAAVRFISAEPLLGPVDLRELWLSHNEVVDALKGNCFTIDRRTGIGIPSGEIGWTPDRGCARIDWVIVGGESGKDARGSCVEVEQWMRDLRDQCAAVGVPFFGKQNFKKFPLPDDLLVREYPNAR